MSTPPPSAPNSPPLQTNDLPFISGEIAPIAARIKERAEDFRVHEIPAYPPTGSGDHLWVHFEKANMTTEFAVKQIARCLGVAPRDAGYAGMKDRQAITTQWASFLFGKEEALNALNVPGLRLLTVTRHAQKLRTGHLRGNRFELVLRGIDTARLNDVRAVLTRVRTMGLPNYFGAQRFGFDGRNVSEARAWIVEGGQPPRDMWKKKLLVSVLQSAVFNDVVASRIRDGLFDHAVDGDVLKKEDTGGLFTTADLGDAEARVLSWAVSPTGPMFGDSMRPAEREALARDEAALARAGLTAEHVKLFGRAGEGTRRVMRVRPEEVAFEPAGDAAMTLSFSLPKGAYATVLVREITKGVEPNLSAGDEHA